MDNGGLVVALDSPIIGSDAPNVKGLKLCWWNTGTVEAQSGHMHS